MAGFSEQYRAYRRWATNDRTPEDYEEFLRRKAVDAKVHELLNDNSLEEHQKWRQLETLYDEFD